MVARTYALRLGQECFCLNSGGANVTLVASPDGEGVPPIILSELDGGTPPCRDWMIVLPSRLDVGYPPSVDRET